MNQTPDQRIIRLVQSCAGLSPEERQDYLDRECGGDEELRRSVENSVRADAEMENTQAFVNEYERSLPAHYRLIEMIGRGGMAEVFLAEDTRLNRSVAIKFLNSEFRKDPERMRRFNQEARAASALSHPNILIIHDIGESEGVQFIVSEFVEGETLAARISRGKIPLAEAVNIAIQIASALAASHKAGIVHRDIKPDNVMVRDDGSVKVLDFGLAKETGTNFSNSADFDAKTLDRVSTSPGLILGTPQYMSPEQARGKQLDARSDIFSLGIIIFEMVTGRPPFAGGSMADIIADILGKEPRRLEEFLVDPPVTLIRIVQKALRKNRDERYGTAEHLLSDLKDLKLELVDEMYSGQETGGTHVRTTLQNTIGSVLTGKLINWKMIVLLAGVVFLGFAAWWFLGSVRQNELPIQGSMRTVGITSWSSGAGELVAAASFSPDARMVAFAATKSGTTEIWVKPAIGGDAIQVTKNGFYNQYPVWSLNGQNIAFFSSRGENRGIWRASFTGGEQTQIVSGVKPSARPTSWTKSGKIYFQEGMDLFAVSEASGERTRVTDFESKGLKPRVIEVSEDESTIAYSIKENDLWKVKIKRLDAEASDEIAVSKDQVDYLAWHPDGQKIIFSNSVDGAYQIFEASVGQTAPVQMSNGNMDFFVQDVSFDGSMILYGSLSETSDLWTVDIQDSRESLIADDVTAEFWGDISPDGKSIAYQSVKQVDRPFGGSINVRPLNVPGTPIVVSPAGFSPVWAKNGQWIAFFRRTETGIAIWRARPTGDEAVKLADGAVNAPGYTATPYVKIGINHLSWSPDSESVAYSALADGMSNIWLAASDGSRTEPLSDNKDTTETYCCPTWSSDDGRFIVFSSERTSGGTSSKAVYRLWQYLSENSEQRLVFESTERFRFLGFEDGGKDAVITQKADPADLTFTPESTYVYTLSLQTGAKMKVNTLGNAYFHNIHLSPDGRSIAFVSRRDNITALWVVPVTGGTPRRLLAENDPKVLISSLAWSPDGRSIVFGRQTRTNLLSMLAK